LIYFIFRDIEFFPLTLSCFEFAEALGKTASGNQSLQTVIDNRAYWAGTTCRCV